MKQQISTQNVLRCGLGVTDNARKGIMKFAKDEHAFFSMQEAFDIHIEKRPENRQGNLSFSFFFDNQTNDALAKRLDDRVAVMECVYKHDGFLATGFHVRGKREPVRTNRRLAVRLKFQTGRNSGASMPVELYTGLRELPIAEERSEYVKKRIASWEGYLRIQERNADVEDVVATISNASLNENFSKVRLVCKGLKGEDWQTIKGFSAKKKGTSQDIGNVSKVDRSKNVIEIELNRPYQELARKNQWHPKVLKEVVFSNFAELSQVRRLRKGFKDLQDGLAANPNLEKVLFEERPVVRISKTEKNLEFHNNLNEFQQEAVVGAMTANDLYVIQGPPGTGKTTVISEICYQNVKAGLRTLVASQANLAVDNALGRLLSHQDIRILRYGRTESIEEEGKKFIEENVALNWKEQTLQAVYEQLDAHIQRESQLENELKDHEKQLQALQVKLSSLEEQVKLKKAAEEEYAERSTEIEKLTKSVGLLMDERDKTIDSQEKLRQMVNEQMERIDQLERETESRSMCQETVDQMEELAQDIKKLRQLVTYRQTLQQIGETVHTLATFQQALERNQRKNADLNRLQKELQSITKLTILQEKLDLASFVPPFATAQKITELNRLIHSIKADALTGTYAEWRELTNRLEIAIERMQLLLNQNGFRSPATRRPPNQKYTTVKDIHQLIDQTGRFLVKPSTKQILATRNYSAEKYDTLEKIAIARDILHERMGYAKTTAAGFQHVHHMMEDSKKRYAVIHAEMIASVKESIHTIEKESNTLQKDAEHLQMALTDLQQKSSKLLAQLGTIDEKTSIDNLKNELVEKEQVYAAYQETKAILAQYALELEQTKHKVEELTGQINSQSAAVDELNKEIEKGSAVMEEQKLHLANLKEIIVQQPEMERKETLTEIDSLTQTVEQLELEKARLPITQTLQEEWLSLLEEANDYDLDEIRKLYVRHANVIGTTCVASARRDFMEDYPTFDVVIIDEVSKATPPELLLPMLKGKKIILVGDHHQLPPLVGQETMEEFLEEIEDREEKQELAKLLNESLFERLFRTLPKQNKTMLAIQYRMHESIMETITPFYAEGDYRLRCGLTDSDTMRDHLLESRYVKRHDHLLWFDMPNKPEFFEEKMKGGTSRFNPSELNRIRDLLQDLDTATERAKAAGRMAPEAQKSVGVISFYGEQVKRIDRLIHQELIPKHLHCRTGSVDKFQGMEMDVIILSFVRNHADKGGDIGFAKDYRRLNVALSRARELLIIVGSSEMFTERTKHVDSREMYGRLLKDVQKNNGLMDVEGNVQG